MLESYRDFMNGKTVRLIELLENLFRQRCWNDRKTRSKTCWKSCGRRTQGCQGAQPEALCKAEITQGCIIYIDSELPTKNQATRIRLLSAFSTQMNLNSHYRARSFVSRAAKMRMSLILYVQVGFARSASS